MRWRILRNNLKPFKKDQMENQELMNIIFGITRSTGVGMGRGINSKPNKIKDH